MGGLWDYDHGWSAPESEPLRFQSQGFVRKSTEEKKALVRRMEAGERVGSLATATRRGASHCTNRGPPIGRWGSRASTAAPNQLLSNATTRRMTSP